MCKIINDEKLINIKIKASEEESNDIAKGKNIKGYRCLNKTRYKELIKLIHSVLRLDLRSESLVYDEKKIDEVTEHILYGIRELFNFDPNASVYSREYGMKQIERKRQEAANQGKSSYELYSKRYRNSNKNKTD